MSRSRPVDHNWFMAIRRSRELRPSVMDIVDGALFAFAGLSTIWLAYLVFRASIQPGWPMLLLIVFWVLLTYLLLPRLHRILTRLYVPGTSSAAPVPATDCSATVNPALLGQEAQVHAAMTRADGPELMISACGAGRGFSPRPSPGVATTRRQSAR